MACFVILLCLGLPALAAAYACMVHRQWYQRDVLANLCVGCGYSRRDLSPNATCPECGRDEAGQQAFAASRDLRPAVISLVLGAGTVLAAAIILASGGSFSVQFFTTCTAIPLVALATIVGIPRHGRHRCCSWILLLLVGGAYAGLVAHAIHDRATATAVGQYGRGADLQMAGVAVLGLGMTGIGAVSLIVLWAFNLLTKFLFHKPR